MKRVGALGLSLHASTAVILLTLVAWPSAARALDCVAVTEDAIKELFVEWNKAVQTGDPDTVVARYASDAVLLPTVENGPEIGPVAIKGYFVHFLADKPNGAIEGPHNIRIGCNMALDAGLYTFSYGKPDKPPTPARYTFVYEYKGGRWLIAHHHSSKRPISR